MKKYLEYFVVIGFFILIILILHNNLYANFIGKTVFLFSDIKIPIDWLQCNFLNYNLYDENLRKCDNKIIPRFNYGHIFLSLPYNETLDIFYRNYLPYIIIFIFVLSVNKIIKPKNIFEYSIFFLCVFNPSSFLMMERMNFDIFIFLLIIFLVYNRIYIFNWLLIFFTSFLKIYPVALTISIFLENKNRSLKKIFLILGCFLIFSIFYLYLYKENYYYLLKNLSGVKAGYHFLFSLNTLPKIFKYIFNLNYIFLIVFFYTLFFILSKKFVTKFTILYNKLVDNFYSTQSRLFFISGCVSIFCFVFFSNYIYREAFLILLLPYLLLLYHDNKNLLKIFVYLFLARYLFMFLYAYFNVNDGLIHLDGVRVFSNEFIFFITLKGVLDFITMSFFSALIYLKIFILIKEIKKKFLL